MKSKTLTWVTATTLFAVLAIPLRLMAQEHSEQKKEHTRYKLVDLGTFGGPTSSVTNGGIGTPILNNRGMITGQAETTTPDPNAPNCANVDCFVSHAFRWQNGVLTDLEALPGVSDSGGFGINERGWIAGGSGQAVLWNGQILKLETLGGGSLAIAVNNRGQVAGCLPESCCERPSDASREPDAKVNCIYHTPEMVEARGVAGCAQIGLCGCASYSRMDSRCSRSRN